MRVERFSGHDQGSGGGGAGETVCEKEGKGERKKVRIITGAQILLQILLILLAHRVVVCLN